MSQYKVRSNVKNVSFILIGYRQTNKRQTRDTKAANSNFAKRFPRE